MNAVRGMDKTGRDGITVCIAPGEYRVSSLTFDTEDSGTADCPVTYRSDGGEVVLHAGVSLRPEDFHSVQEYPAIADRLNADARKNVIVLDLTQKPYSLTAADWGKIYALGSYHTADQYDGDWTGPLYCELFVNDQRQALARYPDSGFLQTEEVVKTGQSKESDGVQTENWEALRDPGPDVYRVNEALSGQTICGNLLINIPRYALHLGGGRDLTVTNNIILNAGECAVSYDERARDGALRGGWFDHAAQGGDLWRSLYDSPWQSAVWQTAFPQYRTMTDDFAQAETAGFIPNPANSTLRGNVIFDRRRSVGSLAESAERFGDTDGNAVFPLYKIHAFFRDAEHGDYRIRDPQQLQKTVPEFQEIPLDQIGRTAP